MPISGLVITFERDVANCDSATAQLRDHPAIEIGAAKGNKLAIAVETTSKHHDQEIWDWVHQLPAVSMVQVAFVGFDDACDPADPGGPISHENGELS